MVGPFLVFWRLMQLRDPMGSALGLPLVDSRLRGLFDDLDILKLGLIFLLRLVLLLSQSVQKLMRLGHYLRNQGVVVEVLNEEDPPVKLEVIICNLIYVSDKILILKVKFKELLIIAEFWVVLWNIWHLNVHA